MAKMSMPRVNAQGMASAQNRRCRYSGGGRLVIDSASSSPNCTTMAHHMLHTAQSSVPHSLCQLMTHRVSILLLHGLSSTQHPRRQTARARRTTCFNCTVGCPSRLVPDCALSCNTYVSHVHVRHHKPKSWRVMRSMWRTSGGMAAASWVRLSVLRPPLRGGAACAAPGCATCRSPATGCLITRALTSLRILPHASWLYCSAPHPGMVSSNPG